MSGQRGQLHGDGLRPFRCQHCGNFHVGHGDGLTRADHQDYHSGRIERGQTSDPQWLTIREAAAQLQPRSIGRMCELLERMAREERVEAIGALGVTLIHRDEVPRLRIAALDRAQDKRLKEIG